MAEEKKIEKKDDAPPDMAKAAEVAKVNHDKVIADAIAAEKKVAPESRPGSFGPFADHPARFRVDHELVDRFPRGTVVTYRDFVQHNDPEKRSVNATQTKAVVDRLVGLGAITPLRGDG